MDSDPSMEFPPLASVAAPSNGPSKTSPSLLDPSRFDPSRVDPSRVGLIRTPPPKPPAARARVVNRPSGTSPKFLVVILGLLGAALVAGAGIGGWYWWKSHYAAPTPVTIAAVPHLTPAPPPVQVAPRKLPPPAAPVLRGETKAETQAEAGQDRDTSRCHPLYRRHHRLSRRPLSAPTPLPPKPAQACDYNRTDDGE